MDYTSNMGDKDLVSKCVAIQYGVFIVGIVLLLIVSWNWYSNYSSSCLANCKNSPQSSAGNDASENFTFTAPSKSAEPAKQTKPTGKLDESTLHEGFLNYSPVQSQTDFQSYYSKSDFPESAAYDPAKESLEQSVFDSHKEFVEDSYISTQGPSSVNVERDDEVGPVTRWGLRRVDYTSIVPGDDARQVPSEYPDQVEQTTNTYVL